MLRHEGFKAFYRGFGVVVVRPHFLRTAQQLMFCKKPMSRIRIVVEYWSAPMEILICAL